MKEMPRHNYWEAGGKKERKARIHLCSFCSPARSRRAGLQAEKPASRQPWPPCSGNNCQLPPTFASSHDGRLPLHWRENARLGEGRQGKSAYVLAGRDGGSWLSGRELLFRGLRNDGPGRGCLRIRVISWHAVGWPQASLPLSTTQVRSRSHSNSAHRHTVGAALEISGGQGPRLSGFCIRTCITCSGARLSLASFATLVDRYKVT